MSVRLAVTPVFIMAMAMCALLFQRAMAETLLPEPDPSCQALELPANDQLADFESMRAHYSMQPYQGMIIGAVHSIQLPVFNVHDPAENNFLYRFINNIHIATKDSVIQRQLLFKQGDSLNPRLLAESERLLRNNNYLSDAIVLPYQRCGDLVDLVVVVRDLWTLLPKLYLSRKGGENKYGLVLEDSNIAGSGDTLYMEFIHEPQRDSTSLGYAARQLFDSRFNLDALYADNSDGRQKRLELTRPFYALDASWSMAVKFNQRLFDETLQAFNRDSETFQHADHDYQLSLGYSRGLMDGFSHRYSLGFSRMEDLFDRVDSMTTIPADRVLAYPWLHYSMIEDDFALYQNLNALYRTEDIPIGSRFSASLGYADDSFDSALSQWVFTLDVSHFLLTLNRHLLRSQIGIDGFWDRDSDDLVNTIGSLDLAYYWLTSENQRLYAGLSYDHGKNLAQDQLLALGDDEGLRGYPSEYLLGEQRLLTNLEYRYFFDSHYLGLFRFAGVIFFDMGQTWYSDNREGADSPLLTSTGLGLRLNSSKTNISRIVHIDLGFPLQRKKELDDYQLRISAEATF